MSALHIFGIIVVKLWWLIIPVTLGTLYGIRSDMRE